MAAGAARARRGLIVLLLAGSAILLGSSPAWAHSRLLRSDPADGASVPAPPASVTLTFNEDPQPGFNVMTLIGPDGRDYHSGRVREVDQNVTVDALPLGPAGVYKIEYRVVSADGHPVSGATTFTLVNPGPGSAAATFPNPAGQPAAVAPSSAPPPGTAGGAPAWPWIAGAVVLIIAGVGLALRLGRT